MDERVPLKHYTDARLSDMQRLHDHDVGAVQHELANFRTAVAAVQDELQRQVTELHVETGHLVAEKTYQERHDRLIERIDSLERWQANLTGRAVAIGILYSVLLVAVTYAVAHRL